MNTTLHLCLKSMFVWLFYPHLVPTICVCSETPMTSWNQWADLARKLPTGNQRWAAGNWQRIKSWERSTSRSKLFKGKRSWRTTWKMPTKGKREITKAKGRRSWSHYSPSERTNSKCKPWSQKCGRPKFSSKSLTRKKLPKIIHINWNKLSSINKLAASTMALGVQVQHATNIWWSICTRQFLMSRQQ
jgi:hypothetical protein